MILGIDPKVDFAFKYLLGKEANRALLIDVLNKVLDLPPGNQIQDIELLNPYNLQEALDDKLSILDIKARDETGRQFNVEMQMVASPYYVNRIIYYWSKLHQQQLHDGEHYGSLRPTISISFLNHILFPEVPDYHLRFHLLEDRHHFALGKDVEFHVIEFPKFNKTLSDLKGGLDFWLYFLRFAETMDDAALPPALAQPTIVRATEVLKMITQSDIERERYEARRKYQMDHDSALIGAQILGEQLGEQRGEQRGKQIGKQIGLIHAYERILRRPATPEDQLFAMSAEDLTRLAAELENQAINER